LVFHGNNYDYYTVYNLPIWLRKYTYSEIQKYHKPKETNTFDFNNPDKSKLPPIANKIKPPNYITGPSPKK